MFSSSQPPAVRHAPLPVDRIIPTEGHRDSGGTHVAPWSSSDYALSARTRPTLTRPHRRRPRQAPWWAVLLIPAPLLLPALFRSRGESLPRRRWRTRPERARVPGRRRCRRGPAGRASGRGEGDRHAGSRACSHRRPARAPVPDTPRPAKSSPPTVRRTGPARSPPIHRRRARPLVRSRRPRRTRGRRRRPRGLTAKPK